MDHWLEMGQNSFMIYNLKIEAFKLLLKTREKQGHFTCGVYPMIFRPLLLLYLFVLI